jgi:hypothetical protein
MLIVFFLTGIILFTAPYTEERNGKVYSDGKEVKNWRNSK